MKHWSNSTILATVMILVMLPVFFVFSQLRLQDYLATQTQIAASATSDAAEITSRFIAEKQRLVHVFAHEHIDLLKRIKQHPNDDQLVKQLNAKTRLFFPEHFAVTLADIRGDLILDDFDGFIGEICRADLHEYVKRDQLRARIHPNPFAYHFDVAAEWTASDNQGFILISFRPQTLTRILDATRPEQQTFYLVIKDQGYLIESSNLGDRGQLLGQDNLRLTAQEQKQIIAEQPVANSYWHIVALPDRNSLGIVKNKIYMQTALVAGLFVAVVLVLWLPLHRHEKQKREMARSLEEKNSILELENELALNVYDRITRNNNESIPGLKVHTDSMSTFSGDLMLSYGRDENRFYFLLGDFTGHGLGAALGAIPLADVFFNKAKQQADIGDLVRSCNEKLLEVLPTERFCCALIIVCDRAAQATYLCNAGLPEAKIIDHNGQIKGRCRSSMPPLGSLRIPSVDFEQIDTQPGDAIIGYTDGITETRAPNNEMFGERGVIEAINRAAGRRVFEGILEAVDTFSGNTRQRDDVSLFQLSCCKLDDH
jgi:serine phosphatase RsbU (regulator of sigma subunit)